MAIVLTDFIVLLEKMCVIVVIAYLMTRSQFFNEVLEKKLTLKNQIILILIFGAISIYGSVSGIHVFGAIGNIRDLGPIIAGLIGGPLVGLGAGLIGGVFRFSLGGITCVPCSLATVLAGLFAGLLYLVNKGKFIGIKNAVIFTILMESFHMILVLLLAQPFSTALEIVKALSIPIIACNAIGVLIFSYIIVNRIKEKETASERDKYLGELKEKEMELKIAHNIQESFLPDKMPDIKGFDISALNQPAKEVGGDFFDFIELSDSTLGIVIADVSGKGVPGALFMASSRTIIRASAIQAENAQTTINEANKLIAQDAKSGMFVTVFYGVLDTEHNILTYVNAGHNHPLFFKKKSSLISHITTKGIALGALDEINLYHRKLKLEKGDLVLFYTDGVTEAMDNKENQFGEERLIKIIKQHHDLSSKEIIEKINEEIGSFIKNAPQFDDITIILLKME